MDISIDIDIETLIYGIALAGVAVNAAAGVLEAGRKPFDLFGMVVVALAAALGGGSLRDVLLDRTVFWIADQSYLIAAIVAGLATFALVRVVRLPARLFLIPDAIGLALFTVSGTQAALAMEAPWLVAVLMGVITGVFGGMLSGTLLAVFFVPAFFVFVIGTQERLSAWRVQRGATSATQENP